MSVWNYGIEKKCWFRINDGDGDGSEDTSCSLPQLFLKKLFVLFYHWDSSHCGKLFFIVFDFACGLSNGSGSMSLLQDAQYIALLINVVAYSLPRNVGNVCGLEGDASHTLVKTKIRK